MNIPVCPSNAVGPDSLHELGVERDVCVALEQA
jgi:hypothetical protein